MAVFKLSTLFNLTTALSTPGAPVHRSAGWSESIYGSFASVTALLAEAGRGTGFITPAGGGFPFQPGYWQARASLLPLGAAIVGARVQQVDVPGPVQTVALNLPGIQTRPTDIPQMALLMRSPGLGVNNVRRFTLRCIPDAQVIEGEFQPDSTYQTLIAQFITSLTAWAFRVKSVVAQKFKIITVDATGVLTAEQALPFALSAMVRVNKTKDSGSNLRSGRFQVAVVGPGTNVVKLFNWPFGATVGGTVVADSAVSYPSIDVANTAVSRVVTRRVGRPFVGYRGRRSKRR